MRQTGSVDNAMLHRVGLIRMAAAFGLSIALSACASPPARTAANGRVYDPKLGVWSSPRVVADGDPVPRGGGSYLTGRTYTIGGRTYVPSRDPSGYSAVGMASWYGDAFHGRRTANGEIFDKGSVSAAHPTLPLPSYVRVTNTRNGRSMVVRVNDRGPYHGGRVMDVSQRVAEALQFRGEGTAKVRIDYLGRAALAGSDDIKLVATLRTDGSLAQLDGFPSGASTLVADTGAAGEASAGPSSVVPEPETPRGEAGMIEDRPAVRSADVPLPPQRPFSLGSQPTSPTLGPRDRTPDHLAELLAAPPAEAFRPADRSSVVSASRMSRRVMAAGAESR